MYQYPFLDFDSMNTKMNEDKVESHNKLKYIHEYLGGDFHDPEKRIMTGSKVAIVSIGSFPVELSDEGLQFMGSLVSLDEIVKQLYKSVGMSSFMSYLNPKNKTLTEISDSTLELEHYSVLHMINLSILVSGISIGVEHEFSSQRDIVHLSRVTVAKTKAQSYPCLVLNNKKHYHAYKKVLKITEESLGDIYEDDNETRNLLFPSAKASAVILTGSLKNMMKLVALKDAGGKEHEFIKALENINDSLNKIFPQFFN
jgi:hypothetical protein